METDEPAKLEAYFREGRRLWEKSPKLVVSRRFYELWEVAQNPLPFQLPEGGFDLGGIHVDVPPDAGPMGAHCAWDDARSGAVLTVEENGIPRAEYLLGFAPDGSPSVRETPLRKLELRRDSLKFDAANVIIGSIRASGGELDFSGLNKHGFWRLLELLPPNYPPEAKADLRSLKLEELRSVFEKALSDRASDELGSQLELPLFGTYSRDGGEEPPEIVDRKELLPALTFWQVRRILDLLSETDRLMIEFERNFTLDFGNATVAGGSGPDYILELEQPEDAPVFQEDILEVFRKSDRSRLGTFRVDFLDGRQLMGRFTMESGNPVADELPNAEGSLIRGPSEFMKERLDAFREELSPEKPFGFLNAGAYAAGLLPVPFVFPEEKEGADGLNASQRLAFATAIRDSNPLVLIQGPPGTGKTHVLRHIVRFLHSAGKRILITAPSHAAVDNICRGIDDLPFLRCGRFPESIAPDVLAGHWSGDRETVRKIRSVEKRGKQLIYAGTHAALLKDFAVKFDFEHTGPFDAVVFDEAGMSGLEEILLCSTLAKRAILLGDHRQLPPFPKPRGVLDALLTGNGRILESNLRPILTASAMEWLSGSRKCPSIRLNISYRCRNPRLLRFISSAFYDAGIKPDPRAEYYRLPLPEREIRFPSSTLRWIDTSSESESVRSETVVIPGSPRYSGGRPGIWNRLEAELCVRVFADMRKRFPLDEITLITPYRAQSALLRKRLSEEFSACYGAEEWKRFLAGRISTVDSFQGGESDAVIISYVRSNPRGIIGFTDQPNRINVAHTRCRMELAVVGDLACLKKGNGNGLFQRLEQAFRNDGEVVPAETVLSAESLQPTLF